MSGHRGRSNTGARDRYGESTPSVGFEAIARCDTRLMGSWRRLAGLAAVAMLAVGVARADAFTPPVLVKDINPGALGGMNDTITPAARLAYFVAFDPAHGRELWASDGTESGTRLVKDINPGPVRSIGAKQDLQRVAIGSELYFVAIDGVHGAEVWKTDGSEAGTTMVTDLTNGVPRDLTGIGPELYFSAQGPEGRELWRSNGTAAGTQVVKGANGGARNPEGLRAVGRELYFSANDGVHGRELWKSDGTAAGTRMVKDIFHGSRGSDPSDLIAYRHQVYFAAEGPGNGDELRVSNGTARGTRLVKDIRNGPGSGLSKFSSVLTVAGHTLYFIATTPRQGRELWASTGTSGTTRLVSDIAPGKAGSDPAALTAFKSRLAFDADDGIHGRELWITDGRRRDTRLVRDIRPGSGGGLRASNVASLGGDLYFQANDGTSGAELWRSDGTPTGTSQVADINAGPRSSYPGPFGVLGRVLLFSADDGIRGRELWRLTN